MDLTREWMVVAMLVLSMGCAESYTKSASDSGANDVDSDRQMDGAGGISAKGSAGDKGSSTTDADGQNGSAGGNAAVAIEQGGPDIKDAPAGTVLVEGTPSCAGIECKENERCCLLTGECFDPVTSPQACVAPTQENDPDERETCASNADCAPDEYCENQDFCLGPGKCQSRVNCGESHGDDTKVCGCNGITYPNLQSACFAGVRIAGHGACGVPQTEGAGGSHAGSIVIPCAKEGDCPDGQLCCALTGRCYDEKQPVLCSEPPEGTYRACVDDSHCLPEDFCYGEGCEGPGGCMYPGSSECTGVLQPVCGCDGQTYTNTSCAIAAGIRVHHDGECE